MNSAAAKILTDTFVTSGFDALDALLGLSFSTEIDEPVEMSGEEMLAIAQEYDVWMRAKIAGGGAVLLALQKKDVAKVIGLLVGEEDKTELEEPETGTLQEIAGAVLGGGVAQLSDFLEEDVELEGPETVWDQDAAGLAEFVGTPGAGARFSFKAEPHFDGRAVFLYAPVLEGRVPEGLSAKAPQAAAPGAGDAAPEAAPAPETAAVAQETEAAESPLVSDEEINDILSGFTPEDEPDRAVAPPSSGEPMPENFSVIMDIELIATARLGKVELPLSEVLNFGPGSIIEVGHLIDDPVELLVNDKLIARGDVVVVDEKFGLRITEIISPQERIETLR